MKNTALSLLKKMRTPLYFILVLLLYIVMLSAISVTAPKNITSTFIIFGLIAGILPVMAGFLYILLVFLVILPKFSIIFNDNLHNCLIKHGIFLNEYNYISDKYHNIFVRYNEIVQKYSPIMYSIFSLSHFILINIVIICLVYLMAFTREKYYAFSGSCAIKCILKLMSGASEKPGRLFKVGHQDVKYNKYKEENIFVLQIDDMGQLYDWTEINKIIEYIETKSENICLITFVHGWNHNASPKVSGNLDSFRTSIFSLQQKMIREEKNTTVIGIFIGWQGIRYSQPFQTFMTFFDRSRKSREVGSGDIKNIYMGIDNAFQKSANVKVFHVGHSLGASILYTAFSSSILQSLTEDTVKEDTEKLAATQKPEKSTLIMVNPAFEGKYYLPLYNRLENSEISERAPEKEDVYIITSNADGAINKMFKLFKYVMVFTESFRNDLERRCLYNSVGSIEEFKTHNLGREVLQETNYKKNTKGRIMIATVGKDWIKDHNDIWNDELQNQIIKKYQSLIKKDETNTPANTLPKTQASSSFGLLRKAFVFLQRIFCANIR